MIDIYTEKKDSNQGLLNALSNLELQEDDTYYIAFDQVVDNQDIRNKYRLLKSMAEKSEGIKRCMKSRKDLGRIMN